jgi:hypothetical protein
MAVSTRAAAAAVPRGAGLAEVLQHLAAGGELLPHHLDRALARHLARGVATHPVGDDEETELGIDRERVLVVLALPPDVGQAVGLGGQGHWRAPLIAGNRARRLPGTNGPASAS